MNPLPVTAPYSLLQACGVGARAHEALNVGIVLHATGAPLVGMSEDVRRLAALHPDFAAVALADRAQAMETFLASRTSELTPQQRHDALRLFAQPFQVVGETPSLATLHDDPRQTLRELMQWLVLAPGRTLAPVRAKPAKRPTRLLGELRQWLRQSKAFGNKVEDLSRGQVVANYPVLPSADLYADLAVMNGKLHVLETLDLRGVQRLTPSLRGDAAIKGVTLDEARRSVDGRRIAVISASDYQIARPAIGLIGRYADDVWDMHVLADRQRLAEFFAASLHRPELPRLDLAGCASRSQPSTPTPPAARPARRPASSAWRWCRRACRLRSG